MKVFGIGLNKTGTTSLGRALEILGFNKHISCDLELTKAWENNTFDPIFQAAEQYNNFEDWPWPLVYKDLYHKFDDAKFILTIRDSADVWFESLCKHADRTGPTLFRKMIYGHAMPHQYKEEHIHFYNTHNDQVKQFFQEHNPNKLLIISLADGNNWETLCPFLDCAIPDVDFPFLNTSQQKSNFKLTNFFNRIKNKISKE